MRLLSTTQWRRIQRGTTKKRPWHWDYNGPVRHFDNGVRWLRLWHDGLGFWLQQAKLAYPKSPGQGYTGWHEGEVFPWEWPMRPFLKLWDWRDVRVALLLPTREGWGRVADRIANADRFAMACLLLLATVTWLPSVWWTDVARIVAAVGAATWALTGLVRQRRAKHR